MSRSKNETQFRRWTRFVILALIVVAVASLGLIKIGSYVGDSRAVRVVAAENFWGNIAQQIGGNQVGVTSVITNPNADPHLYESDAHDAIAVADANVVIENGLGYDDFMNKLVSASPNSSRQIVQVASVLKVTGQEANPHLWYDTPQIPIVAAQMAAVFATKDPAKSALFTSNLRVFDASLEPIIELLAKIKQEYAGTPVAYTERVPGYLLANAGLIVKTPVGFSSAIEDGVDPSPADTYDMDRLLKDRKVRVLLYNAQTVSPVTQQVRQLARQENIPVVAVTETMPAGDSYQSWQLDQLQSLEHALNER